jgi:endoglucanase
MAYSMTVMAWGLIDYESAYTKAGELENAKKAIKWGTDYFIKVRVVLFFDRKCRLIY